MIKRGAPPSMGGNWAARGVEFVAKGVIVVACCMGVVVPGSIAMFVYSIGERGGDHGGTEGQGRRGGAGGWPFGFFRKNLLLVSRFLDKTRSHSFSARSWK